jgi:acetyl esterase/lipase
MQDLNAFLTLRVPPPLDEAWLAHEVAAGLMSPSSSAPAPPPLPPLERQPIYAAACRERNAAMLAPGGRDHELLGRGVRVQRFTVAATASSHASEQGESSGFAVPVLRFEVGEEGSRDDEVRDLGTEPMGETGGGGGGGGGEEGPASVVIFYIHGGGLLVGEADSEELTCRRLVKCFTPSPKHPRAVLYSVGYRLRPSVAASTCLADVLSALSAVRARHPLSAGWRLLVVGSSSGGELAALATQTVAPGTVQGALLRCPVTVDAPALVPEYFRVWHVSASAPSGPAALPLPPSLGSSTQQVAEEANPFVTSLLGAFPRAEPRDGLDRMPLECPPEELRALRLPRTWIQVCTNDVLYSDGVCYAKALQDAGVEVKVDVVAGWPHTFWLKAPHLDRALEAEEELLRGLAWVLEGP